MISGGVVLCIQLSLLRLIKNFVARSVWIFPDFANPAVILVNGRHFCAGSAVDMGSLICHFLSPFLPGLAAGPGLSVKLQSKRSEESLSAHAGYDPRSSAAPIRQHEER